MHHAQPGVRGLQAAQHALAADDLRLGRLADGARVDDDEVGGVHRRRLGAARGEQAPGHLLGVALVHLAAQRPDEERRQRADLGAELREPLVGGRERVARAGRAGDRRGDVEDGQRSSGHAVAHGSAGVSARCAAARSAVDQGLRHHEPGVRLGVRAVGRRGSRSRPSSPSPSSLATALTLWRAAASNER